MPDSLNPLEYQYKTLAKLDYFILSGALALLGWTVVNSDLIIKAGDPKWPILVFWSLLGLSLLGGIIKQLYNAMMFGANHYMLHYDQLASELERASLDGAVLVNQQTGNPMNPERIREIAAGHRQTSKDSKLKYDFFSVRSVFYGNVGIVFLVAAVFTLTALRIQTL